MDRQLIENYRLMPGPDEMVGPDLSVRPAYEDFVTRLLKWQEGEFEARQSRADLALLNAGITFTVYNDDQGTERIFPFSLVPRIVSAAEWAHVERGLVQRVTALNMFLADVYGERRCLAEGVIPSEIVLGSVDYNAEMVGWQPPLGVYAHIVGCDLVRDKDGTFRVLEDNLRSPSGVSYVIENRMVMLRVAGDLFPPGHVRPVNDYGPHLRSMLIDVRPASVEPGDVNAVVLTPGIFNSAYFEHAFLAQQMGVTLCEGQDLVVRDDIVYLRSTSGLERVHVIYRRIDDAFLDPLVFLPDSALGVPGLVGAYRAGNVTLVNAIGTGVADDKVVYRFVPDLIRFFLNEEPILPNVETYLAMLPEDREIMKSRMREMVFKPANASGGYGLVVGAQATDQELRELWEQVEAEPRNWLAQPLLEFSSIPTVQDGKLVARRADLRPYVLTGKNSWVLPGGLTRVALREGSYVVNSSQGGGSKDTWVLTGESQDA